MIHQSTTAGEVHAYLLCSVALKLRLSQVVNEPVHTVSDFHAVAKALRGGTMCLRVLRIGIESCGSDFQVPVVAQ